MSDEPPIRSPRMDQDADIPVSRPNSPARTSNDCQNQTPLPQIAVPNNDHWMRAYWRPAMGFTYMVICIFDFIVFPILAMVQPLFMKLLGMSMPYVVWQSLTLQTGGFFHIALGAVLGVAAWTRGQEKISKTK